MLAAVLLLLPALVQTSQAPNSTATTPTMRPRIDTHAHILPPVYREALIKSGHDHPDGMPGIPSWSEEAHLALMEKNNITKSIVSISAPGTALIPGDAAAAATLTREVNLFAADLKRRHPTRFGFLASLPLPFVPEALAEIDAALADGADGFVLLTNHHGQYLGDPAFDAVFAKLNAAAAKLLIHPFTPCQTATSAYPPTEPGNITVQARGVFKATPLMDQYRSPMFEFFFDTARAFINLFLTDTVARCPNTTFIIPHAGGGIPPVFSRFTGYSGLIASSFATVTEEAVRDVLRKQFFFDLAGWVFPVQMWSLVKGMGVGADRLLYGTDYCFTPAVGVDGFTAANDAGMKEMFADEEVERAYMGNAMELFGLAEGDIEDWPSQKSA